VLDPPKIPGYGPFRDDDHAEYVSVSRGASEGGQTEVFGPLAANDRIVRRGTDEIREGSPLAGRLVEMK
jgi:hypothetical protein